MNKISKFLQLDYKILPSKERKYLYWMFFLFGCLQALITIESMRVGFGFAYLLISLLLINIVSTWRYHQSIEGKKPFFRNPIMDYGDSMMLIFLFPSVFVYFFFCFMGGDDLLGAILRENAGWIDRLRLFPFLKRASLFGDQNLDVSRVAFATVFLVYNGLIFVLMSIANSIQLSSFVADFFKKDDSPGGWIFIILCLLLPGLAVGLVEVNAGYGQNFNFANQYQQHLYVKMIAVSWGVMIPLGGWSFAACVMGYIHYWVKK